MYILGAWFLSSLLPSPVSVVVRDQLWAETIHPPKHYFWSEEVHVTARDPCNGIGMTMRFQHNSIVFQLPCDGVLKCDWSCQLFGSGSNSYVLHKCFLTTSVVEPAANNSFHEQASTNPIFIAWMSNYHDMAAVNSLYSWKLPMAWEWDCTNNNTTSSSC